MLYPIELVVLLIRRSGDRLGLSIGLNGFLTYVPGAGCRRLSRGVAVSLTVRIDAGVSVQLYRWNYIGGTAGQMRAESLSAGSPSAGSPTERARVFY